MKGTNVIQSMEAYNNKAHVSTSLYYRAGGNLYRGIAIGGSMSKGVIKIDVEAQLRYSPAIGEWLGTAAGAHTIGLGDLVPDDCLPLPAPRISSVVPRRVYVRTEWHGLQVGEVAGIVSSPFVGDTRLMAYVVSEPDAPFWTDYIPLAELVDQTTCCKCGNEFPETEVCPKCGSCLSQCCTCEGR